MTLKDGKLTVGEFKALAPTHPVFTNSSPPQSTDSPVPGDHEQRVRFMRDWLAAHPDAEPTTSQVAELLQGASVYIVGSTMKAMGYHNTRGRNARWRHTPPAEPAPEITPDIADAAPDVTPQTPTERPQQPAGDVETAWLPVDVTPIADMSLSALLTVYAAAGLDVRVEVRPHA